MHYDKELYKSLVTSGGKRSSSSGKQEHGACDHLKIWYHAMNSNEMEKSSHE